MKKQALFFFALSICAFGQGVRYDVPPILNSRAVLVPNANISLCPGTATITNSTCSPASTQAFTDITLTTPCATGSPVVLPQTNVCSGVADSLGNAGFWLSPGAYIYCINSPTITGKCYNLTVPSGSTSSGSATIPLLNKIITVDGGLYTGPSALQTAILACGSVNSCTVDARNPVIGNQTLTASPFENLAAGFTLYTGPYTISYDMTAFTMSLPHDTTIFGYGTTWLNSNAQSGAALVNDTTGRSAQPQTGILNNRVFGTTGSITTGTNTLTVASAANLRVGQMIAILGARTLSNQATTINQVGGIAAGDSTVTITACVPACNVSFGSPTYQDNYILVDSEIMSYTTKNATSFTGLVRGLFGTVAASHLNGATITQELALVTKITAISGTTITLADNSSVTLTNAFVQAGAMNITIDGNAVFDDGYVIRTNPPVGGTSHAIGLGFLLSQNIYVGPNVRFQNSDLAGVVVEAQRGGCAIFGQYRHVGRPPNNLGEDVALFASTSGCVVRPSSEIDGDGGILIDDRSDTIVRWSGGSNDNEVNLVFDTQSTSYTTCVDIEGFSSNNHVTVPRCNVTNAGIGAIAVVASSQWTSAPVPTSNRIDFGEIDSGAAAIANSGSANTLIIGGKVNSGTTSLAISDTLCFQNGGTRCIGQWFGASLITGGSSATSLAPIYAVTFSRSAGNAGFPDVTGNGSAAVVIGDVNGAGLGSSVPSWSPGAANVTTLGTAALPWKTFTLGTAATNNFVFTPAATAAARTVSIPDPGTNTNLALVLTATSSAFATATTAGTCVNNTTAVAGAATTMAVAISPVSTPGVGAVWSAFVSSAGNVTINECAVATSAGGTIAFNIRVFP